MSALWLAIHFPSLALEINDQGAGTPMGILRNQQLALVNDGALQAGVQPGMKAATAHALCENLQLLAWPEQAVHKSLRQRARLLTCLSPTVSMYQEQGLLIEIASCLRLHGGPEALLARLLRILEMHNWQAELGLGPTPLAAWHLAHFDLREQLACLRQGEAAFHALLERLPISQLDLDDKTRKRLLSPGFHYLRDILPLPRDSLGKRFGKGFLDWLQRLLGEQPDPREPVDSASRPRHEWHFDAPVQQGPQLHYPMQRLLEQLFDALRRRQQICRAIRWQLESPGHGTQPILIRRARPDYRLEHWLDLSQRRLDEQPNLFAVERLRLEPGRLQPLPVDCGNLFAQINGRPGADELLDRLLQSAQLSLYQPACADQQLPEEIEQQQQPLATPFPQQSAAHVTAPSWHLDNPRPLTQISTHQLGWRNQTLTLLPGEQRIRSHWWVQDICREYHLAQHQEGWYCSVFRDSDGRWWLSGFI